MDPGYRSPLVDFFRRGDTLREMRLMAAEGGVTAAALEQVALLVLLADDPDQEVALTAEATLQALPNAELRALLACSDVPQEIRMFFAERGVEVGEQPSADPSGPIIADDDDDDEDLDLEDGDDDKAGQRKQDTSAPTILAGLPVKRKMKLAFKGTREQRAQLIRDPNKIVAAAVLSSPKLTEAEVESFAKMANVSEEVLRVIAMNRTWLKNYGVMIGLVRNPKTPIALSMQLLPRVNERDMKMLAVDRNVPEALRIAARKFIVKARSS